MCFPVSYCYIAITALFNMPDHFFHYHQVTKVRVPTRHKSGEYMKWCAVTYRSGDLVVVPMSDNDTSAHKIRNIREFLDYGGDRIDTKIREQFLKINGLVV